MIEITHFRTSSGRVAATFSAVIGDQELQGCALIRRDSGYSISVPRIGSPSRPVPLRPADLSEIEGLAVAAVEALH